MTAEQLLSLEVLWLPAEGDRWLTKDEVTPTPFFVPYTYRPTVVLGEVAAPCERGPL